MRGGFPNSTFSDVFNDYKEIVKTIVKWKAIVTEISKWNQSIMRELALSLILRRGGGQNNFSTLIFDIFCIYRYRKYIQRIFGIT